MEIFKPFCREYFSNFVVDIISSINAKNLWWKI